MKAVRQIGKDSTIDLDWAVDRSQETYELLFEYFDEIANPHTTKERITISDNCKALLNNLVKSLKLATILSSEETVLRSIFGVDIVEIIEIEDDENDMKSNVIAFDKNQV